MWSDYEQIEPRLGGDEALQTVVAGAHQRGIRVLLDLVCNHLSNEHPIFREALQDEASPYRDWFSFDPRFPHDYRCFFNVKTMPEINLEVPAAREWMIGNCHHDSCESLTSMASAWMWPPAPAPTSGRIAAPACAPSSRTACSSAKSSTRPPTLRKYQGRLDGCLDFSLNEALRNTYGWGSWEENRLASFIESHQRYFGDDFVLPSFLDNHDMDRFSLIAENDSDKLKRAAAKQMSLPNPPIITYGTEVGLRQTLTTRDHTLDVSRVPMVWDERQDQDLLAFYKKQISQRKLEMTGSS